MNKIPMRDGYGKALLKLTQENKKVIALDADVAKSTRTNWVQKEHPECFLDMGISEQDMVGTAAGLALGGMIPFATTYCVFLSGRAFDQIRTTVCYNNLNVKLAGAHAGITVGPDGATHQSLEDVALMRTLPNMRVIVPCDAIETEKAVLAMAKLEGPCFIRFSRDPVPVITSEDTPFIFGKANVLRQGNDAAIIANGSMVAEALDAAAMLEEQGLQVRVINLHTVKPLDEECLLAAAQETGALVTAEEHQINGGTGEAVAGLLAKKYPVPIEMVAVQDQFGESGEPDELKEKYGLKAHHIAEAVLRVHARKNASQ